MRPLKLIGFFILVTTSVACAQEKPRIIEGLSMSSKILSQNIKYAVVLPEDYYTSGKRYPVVYLLHGLGDNEFSWLEYGQVSQIVDAQIKNGEILPMIYIMPQGFRNYYVNDYAGKFMYEDMFIKELVPFVDQQYRTIADGKHRATLGYSMGGFGALVLPLRNPEVISVSVPLSISVRTDSQYEVEDGSEWDEQWGRLFGAVGLVGKERITDYYKQHSPFHIFAQADLSKLKNLKIYIDNGDDEGTLCRSNEELHMLMRDIDFPHEFRVRNGGHEFQYWRDALPNGLRFISDAFEGKPYRGDIKINTQKSGTSAVSKLVREASYEVLLPDEYSQTQRLYPTLFVMGNLDPKTKSGISSFVSSSIKSGALIPLIVVYVNQDVKDIISLLPDFEKKYRARNGWRFRSLMGFESSGLPAVKSALTPETFTSCVLFDSPVDFEELKSAYASNKKLLTRTWFMIFTTDMSKNYQSNGEAHVFLRDEDLRHEYRVQEGTGGEKWMIDNLKEALDFTQRKIHR